MAYTANDKILAQHYNEFVAGSGTFGNFNHSVRNVNTVWAEGNNDRGLGQTPLSQAPVAAIVTATQWASIMSTLQLIDDHQDTTITNRLPGDGVNVASNALVIGSWYTVVGGSEGTGDWPSAGFDAGLEMVTKGGTNNSTGYTDGDALTIGAPDLTGGTQAVGSIMTYQDGALIQGVTGFTPTGVETNEINTYYEVGQKSTSGSGLGVSFTIAKAGGAIDYSDLTITITSPGYGYSNGDTIVIDGTRLGGATITNDLTLTITTFVANGTIKDVGVTTIGTGYTSIPTVTAPTGTIGTLTLTGVIGEQAFKATATTNGQADGIARRPTIVADQIIAYVDTLDTSITEVFAAAATPDAIATATTAVEVASDTNDWNVTSVHTINVQFTSGDHARYFFNAGGNIAIEVERNGGTGTAKDLAWDDQTSGDADHGILPNAGAVTMGAHGTNKLGGYTSATLETEETTIGYYELGLTDITLYQLFDQGGSVYSSNNLTIEAKSNGVQGAAGDNGDLITFTITMSDSAGDPPDVTGTTLARATVNYPATTYITNSWGTVSFLPASTVVQT